MKAKNDNYVQQNASFLSLNTVLDNNPNRSDMNKFNNVNISICNHNYGNNLYSLQLMQKNAILMHQERNSDLFGYICGIVNIINSKDDKDITFTDYRQLFLCINGLNQIIYDPYSTMFDIKRSYAVQKLIVDKMIVYAENILKKTFPQ